jgi:hypothetical protein
MFWELAALCEALGIPTTPIVGWQPHKYSVKEKMPNDLVYEGEIPICMLQVWVREYSADEVMKRVTGGTLRLSIDHLYFLNHVTSFVRCDYKRKKVYYIFCNTTPHPHMSKEWLWNMVNTLTSSTTNTSWRKGGNYKNKPAKHRSVLEKNLLKWMSM